MTMPSVHINGTGKAELERQLEAAVGAVRAAVRAVEDAQPNGRDYYVQGPDATGRAIVEHVARLNRLKSVEDELAEIWQHVADAEGGRP